MTTVGDRQHDELEVRNPPVKIGGRAHSDVPDAVTDGDRVNAQFDLNGRLVVVVEGRNTTSEPKTAFVNATASGNIEIVGAVTIPTNKKIRVTRWVANNDETTTVRVKCQSATTDISETRTIASDGGGFVDEVSQGFLFETVAGQALNGNLSANAVIGFGVTYVEVP